MTKHLVSLTMALAVGTALGASPSAQEKPLPPIMPKAAVTTPLKVQVVISRYQGEKKLSSLPYTLSVNTSFAGPIDVARLRMGVRVPVPMMAAPTVDGKPLTGVPTAGPVTYEDVGTNIDCYAFATDDGRFKVTVTVEDKSVYGDDQTQGTLKAAGNPAFRTFNLTNSAVLKDGQSTQFSTATDKVSGETVKIDVTLTVVK